MPPRVLAEASVNSPQRPRATAAIKKKTKSAQKKKSAHEAQEAYPLPQDLLDVENEREPLGEPWPARALIFKSWPEAIGGNRDAVLTDVLLARGWTDGGGFCDPTDVNEIPRVLSGQHPAHMLPRRALWIPGDMYETGLLHAGISTDGALASRFRVTALPGTSSACVKTYTAKALAAEPFAPLTFVLPAQRAELLAADTALRGSSEPAAARSVLWVGKPARQYAGKGIVVSASAAELANGTGVVQRYVHRPLLVGGYKFHMRVYLLVTCTSPLRAYVHNDLCVMFSTLPYSLDDSTLGAHFERRVHLTNYDINAKQTAEYLADKEGVGRGCLWDGKRLEAWLRASRPDLSVECMWRQIRLIGRGVARSIAGHPNVTKKLRTLPHARVTGHELFGMDVMLDDEG